VVLNGCETWSLTSQTENVWERPTEGIFGPKRDEVIRDWRKLHNELHSLYSSPNIIRMMKSRRMRWAGHVAHMGERRNAYRGLVGKPEGKIPQRRPRRTSEDIKLDLREIGWGCGLDLSDSGQRPVVGSC
jgi:hypothetical protein